MPQGYLRCARESGGESMKVLSVRPLSIPDIKIVRYARFTDGRGYFAEPYRRSDLTAACPEAFAGISFVQSNESFSLRGVVRGLHFQWNPFMGKMVRTISGHMVDMVLDIRRNSPTWGKIVMYDMPARVGEAWDEWIWVPPGFAHGNYYLADTVIEYLCSGEYSQGSEAGISPLAGDLDWSLADPLLEGQFRELLSGGYVISDKDRNARSLGKWDADPQAAVFTF